MALVLGGGIEKVRIFWGPIQGFEPGPFEGKLFFGVTTRALLACRHTGGGAMVR